VQEAMRVAISDDEHVAAQREIYRARRETVEKALRGNGFRIDHSEAGLYLWATRNEACWVTVEWLSQRGVLVAPGDFYGLKAARHVRVALTATDERIGRLAERLAVD